MCEARCRVAVVSDHILVNRQGQVRPRVGRFMINYDPARCPECKQDCTTSVQGRWGEWQLFEARCAEGHYWAIDLITHQRVVSFGYRMDRYTGKRKDGAPRCVTEKWNCRPDPKGRPVSLEEVSRGGYSGEMADTEGLPF